MPKKAYENQTAAPATTFLFEIESRENAAKAIKMCERVNGPENGEEVNGARGTCVLDAIEDLYVNWNRIGREY